MDNHCEKWLPVPGYEGWYEVSSFGRVKSVDRVVSHKRSGSQSVTGCIMIPQEDKYGYTMVILSKGGKKKLCPIHRLVMIAFCYRSDHYSMSVNHIDGIKNNNNIENLEWCTNKENTRHAIHVLGRVMGKPRRGKDHHNSKKVIGRCVKTGIEKVYDYIGLVSNDGFSSKCVSECANGKQKTSGGWQWNYYKDGKKVEWNSLEKKMAIKTSCVNGHSYSDDNIYVDKKGKIYCKICRRDSDKKRYIKSKLNSNKP